MVFIYKETSEKLRALESIDCVNGFFPAGGAEPTCYSPHALACGLDSIKRLQSSK